MFFLICNLITFVLAFQVHAQTPDQENVTLSGHTVGDLLASCKAALGENQKKQLNSSKEKTLHCEGYLDGLLDGYMLGNVAKDAQPLFCLPPNAVSKEQVMQLFIAFAEKHPEIFTEPAATTVLPLFQHAFPCEN